MAAIVGAQSSLVQYKVVNDQIDRFKANFAKLPVVKRDIDYFNEKAAQIKSADDLLKDRRLTEFVLKAFQLEEKVDAKAFIRKLITEDPDDAASLANRLRDPRFPQIAKALHGLSKGVAIFADAAGRKAIIDGYRTNEFEKYQGEQTPGLREALYFKRQVESGQIKDVLQILSSKPLAEVVRVALGLPKEFNTLDAKQRSRFLNSRLEVEKLADPKYLGRFIDRYLANNDIENSKNSQTPLLDLFPQTSGLGINLGRQGLII